MLDDYVRQMGLAAQVSQAFPPMLKPYAIRCLTNFERRKAYLFDKLGALAASNPSTIDRVFLLSLPVRQFLRDTNLA